MEQMVFNLQHENRSLPDSGTLPEESLLTGPSGWSKDREWKKKGRFKRA